MPIVLLSVAALILALSLGIRHAFGLFMPPMALDLGWSRETFALAIALQNLILGLSQPFSGLLADRWGSRPVILGGALLYSAGLALMAWGDSIANFQLGAGVLVGLGLSGTSFAIVFGLIARHVSAEQRSMAFGVASAAGSFGQFIMLPGSAALIAQLGWMDALGALTLLCLLMLPLGWGLSALGDVAQGSSPSVGERTAVALRRACTQRDFWLLALGFAVCGFQVLFIGLHLPAFLLDRGLTIHHASMVLALIGLFNIFGTWLAGYWGGQLPKPWLLSGIYALRTLAIALFAFLPVTPWSAYAFAMAMGLLWLSTVPLTNGTLATFFGVQHLAMLSGIVFLFHQIGAFLGGWLGGRVYDLYGHYDPVWWLAMGLGAVAAILNLPIRETPRRTAHSELAATD